VKPDGDMLATVEVQLAYEVRETSRLFLQALKNRLAPHKITLTQYFLMRQLWEEEGVSQVLLSERLQTTTAASVPIIDALEERGVIKRVRDTKDRRITRIYLTPKGRTLRKKLIGYAYDVSCTALVGLSAREIAALRTVLGSVRSNLEEAAAIEEAG
jgi:DNA-binding MarR family transcriptional regulator